MNIRKWQARWINGETCFRLHGGKVAPAPYLRKTFECPGKVRDGRIFLAAPGWHELYVNGAKIGDRVLSPTVTQFEKHVSYVEYDVSAYLRPGRNAVTVLLGNGWYNCHTDPVPWEFEHAPWRDYPKLLLELVADGALLLKSDNDWKRHTSPTVFDGLRNGEHYDGRLEIPGFSEPDFDDSSWENAALCNPPGGLLVAEELEPCRIMKRYAPISETFLAHGVRTYDFGTNLTGWCEITASGSAGTQIELLYSERVRDNMDIEREEIGMFSTDAFGFQKDCFTLRGTGEPEVWHARFTYHGFRYVQVKGYTPGLKIHKIEACFVHNDFAAVGTFRSSHSGLNRLQEITQQSYCSNFTGIPTDCPHREKNGWTGDANLALETGLWNYDGRKAYEHFMRVFMDTQRLSGQLPGIAPTGGWGYNWGSGPAWDSLIFEAAYQLYLFYGDDSVIREHYDGMKLYLDYCARHESGNLVNFGLGDWCHFDTSRIAPIELTSSGFYYDDAKRMAFFAGLLGKSGDQTYYTELAARIKQSFNAKFRHADGGYADNSYTSLGTALYFGFCDGVEAERTARLLVEAVRANAHKIDFGILGAKFVPRALARYGYVEDMFQMLTQSEFPGWGFWVKRGATSLWEHWNGRSSQNHIMFGDVSACMYRHLAGIAPELEHPGFAHVTLTPAVLESLPEFDCSYRSVRGVIRSRMRLENGRRVYECELPENVIGEVVLGNHREPVTGGFHRYDL